jgi:hypothetical protein
MVLVSQPQLTAECSVMSHNSMAVEAWQSGSAGIVFSETYFGLFKNRKKSVGAVSLCTALMVPGLVTEGHFRHWTLSSN